MPAILRLGVLTMFPLIEALATIPGANYDKLCAQTLDIVIKTIATLPPLALAKEPGDCLEAFKDFISRQIETNNFGIESSAKGQALVALMSLVLSQGRGQHIFHLLDILFKVHENTQQNPSSSSATLPVGASIRQILEHSKEFDVPLPLEPLEDGWTVEALLSAPSSKQSRSVSISQRASAAYAFVQESTTNASIASDGRFLYIHSASSGLHKIGTGLYNTIRGHSYASNPNFHLGERWSSIVCIGDKLYYWSPEHSYDTFRPAKTDSKDNSSPSSASSGASQASQAPSSANPSSGNAPSSEPSASAPLPRISHVIIVLSAEDLSPLTTIRVDDCSLSMQSRMITDGKYLMFVGKQRGKGAKSTLQQQQLLLQQQQQQQHQQQMQQFQLQLQQQHGGGGGLSFGSGQPHQLSLNSNRAAFSLDTLSRNDITQTLSFGSIDSNNAAGGYGSSSSGGFSFGMPPSSIAPVADRWGDNNALLGSGSDMYGEIQLARATASEQPEENENENEDSISGTSSEEEEDSEVDEQDEENEDPEEGSGDEEIDGEEEPQYVAPSSSSRRRRSHQQQESSSGSGSRSRNREEDDAVSNVIAVEWFDISGPFNKPTALSESAAQVPELSNIAVITPIRSLEIPSRTALPGTAASALNTLPSLTGEAELFPPSFGHIAFYTNGHHLVAVSKNMPYRVFSLIDGKPSTELSGPSVIANSRTVDSRDSFAYDVVSNSIWAFRSESSRCTRFHNMGLVPHYPNADLSLEEQLGDTMQVDPPASTGSSKPAAYTFPQLPPLSPEMQLQQLDIWTGAPKKSKIIGLSKSMYTVTERTLKDNLTPMDCISAITASLDRLARHHWAYASHSAVDESNAASTNTIDVSFTVTPSIETLQALFANIQHVLNLARVSAQERVVSSEQSGALLLSFLRLLKLNLHFFCTSGKASNIKEEHRALFSEMRSLLLNLTCTSGMSDPSFGELLLGNSRLEMLIKREASEAFCVGFYIFYPQSRTQIEFLKALVEKSTEQQGGSSLLHDKFTSTLASYYRVYELLLDDSKVSMDVDIPEGTSPSTKVKRTPLASSASQQLNSSASASLKDKTNEVRPNFGREFPFHPQAPALLNALMRKSLSDTYAQLERVYATKSATELKQLKLDEFSSGASQRLLLSLQMEIVALTYAKGLVLTYFESISKIVEEFLQSIKKFRLNEPAADSGLKASVDSSSLDSDTYLARSQWKAAHTVLQSSIVGSLLPALLHALPRKNHVRDPHFVIHVFDRLCHLLGDIDTFNADLSMLARADQIRLVRAAQKAQFRFSSSGAPSGATLTGANTPTDAKQEELSTNVTWLLDLQSAVALLARKCVVTLLEGEPASDRERQCQDWLDTRLLNGGIDENPKNVEKVRWLEAFAEGKEGSHLFTWLKSHGGPRPQARPSAKVSLEKAERYAIAAMMKHAGLVDDAQAFTKTLADGGTPSAPTVGRFSFIAKKASSFASILTRRAEMQKAWQLAIQDKVNDFDVFREMVQRPERLYEFCEMRGVETNPVNSEDTVKRIMKKLQEEIAMAESLKKSGPGVPAPDIFEALCAPVIERASFLLKLLPSNRTVKHPAADSTNPYSMTGKQSEGSNRLRASAPNSAEGGARGSLTKSMSLLPATESAHQKIRQRESEQQDSESFSQRVDELRSWLQAYSDWEQTVLLHNRAKRDEPPPTSPIQGVIAFTTNQSITVKDWERVLRVQATRAKSREQGLVYLHRLLSTCNFAAPRQQLLGPLNVSHYLDGIQSSGLAPTERVTELFGELFIALAEIVKDTTLDSSSRLLALNVCAISYTEHDAVLLQKADIFRLLHQVMSEPAPETHPLGAEAALALKNTHKALHNAAWTCFRLFAVQVVSWRHHDDMLTDRATVTKLQHQAFDVYLLQLKSFSETLVKHDLKDWEREILVLEPHAGRDFAFELVFLLRLLSETSKAWSGSDAVPTLLKFLSSRTAPRAQRVVLRLLRKLLPTSSANKEMVQFCLNEMGKWMFRGKCAADSQSQASSSSKARSSESSMDVEKSGKEDAAPKAPSSSEKAETSDEKSKLSMLSVLGSSDALEQISVSGVEASLLELIKQAYASPSGRSGAEKLTKPLPHADALRLASLRAKFGDVVQLHAGDESSQGKLGGAGGKNEAIASLNPVYWADGTAASMLASEYIALLRFMSAPSSTSWQVTVRESICASISLLPDLVSKLSSDPAKLSSVDAEALFRALSAMCLLSGFSESIRVGCKVVVHAPVVSRVELVTGTVIAYNASAQTAEVVLDTESHEQHASHSFDVKLLQAVPEIELDEANLAPLSSMIPHLLAVINTNSSLDNVPLPASSDSNKSNSGSQSSNEGEKTNLTSSSAMDISAPSSAAATGSDANASSQDSASPATPQPTEHEAPLHDAHHQNAWLFQELKSKALCALNLLLQHPDGAQFMVKECSDSIPALLGLAQRADATTYMEKIERQLTSIAARLWDIQTMPGDLQGRSRRNAQADSRGMIDALPNFWNASKANALPTGLDKTSLSPGTVVLDDDACVVQVHHTRNLGHGHGNFGRPSRGGLSRYGGSKHDVGDITFMFGNCLVPSKGLGQYYFELYIHPEGTVERPNGSSKPHVSIGLVPDPQSSGPASTSSNPSSYRSSYRSGNDVSNPFPPGCYCYVSSRSKAWVSENNVRSEAYGEPFTFGATVGCLWDQTERTISFTKDGEDLDVAFRNVLSSGVGDAPQSAGGNSNTDRLVPCISASRGVQLSLNFGQMPFKYSPVIDDELDAAAREAKRKEIDEKRQKAIQEEQAKRKAEQEQREAVFNEDASMLLSMGFCARHCLRAMMHAGWTHKNRWTNQEGVLMAANWLMEATPEQLGPAGDLPSESGVAPVEEPPKPPQTPASAPKKRTKSDVGKKSAPQFDAPQRSQKPLNPENDYSTTKSSEYILGDAYSLGAPRKVGITQATIWRRDIVPLITSDIPFPSNDPTLQQLIAYAEAGNEDALKSNLTDLYHGKIPPYIRLPSQLKIVENEVVQLKMTQITPEMTVQVSSTDSASSNFAGKTGVVLDRDLKQNLVLLQFVSSEDGSLEEWWLPVTSLIKDRSPTPPFANIHDAAVLQQLLASRTQQYSFFAARRVLLSLMRHAPLAFDVARAKRDLEELARAALPEEALMDVDHASMEENDATPSSTKDSKKKKSVGDDQEEEEEKETKNKSGKNASDRTEKGENGDKSTSTSFAAAQLSGPASGSSSSGNALTSSSLEADLGDAQTVSGVIDVQDAIQLISREYMTSPETLVSSKALFAFDDGMNFAGSKLVELLTRAYEQQGTDACAHLLNAMMQKCIGLIDVASHFTNSRTVHFSHHESNAAHQASNAGSSSSSSSSSAPYGGKKGKSSSSAASQHDTQKSSSSHSSSGASGSSSSGSSPNGTNSFVVSQANHVHKVHIPGARACIVVIHSDTPATTRLNVYLDEDLSDGVNSLGAVSELEGSSGHAPGGPFQPVLVPTNTFWVHARGSPQSAAGGLFGGGADLGGGRANIEYRVTIVPVSSDIALGRWIAEFLTFSITNGPLHVPLDFNPLLNALLDFLYVTPVPSILKESVMALFARIVHDLRRRARGQANKLCQLVDPIGEPLDLSRTNMLKKEMIALYDSEKRSANSNDSNSTKRRGALFSTYLHSLVELMISVRLYDIEKNARQKLFADHIPQSFASGTPDETMAAAVALVTSFGTPKLSSTSESSNNKTKQSEEDLMPQFSLFSEDDMPSGPMKIPEEGEEDSSTTDSEVGAADWDADQDNDSSSRLIDLFASNGVPKPASPLRSNSDAEKNKESPEAPSSADEAAADASKSSPKDSEKKKKKKKDEDGDDEDEGSDISDDADLMDAEGDEPADVAPMWGGYGDMGDMGDMEMDDDLAAAIAMSMQEDQASKESSPEKSDQSAPDGSGNASKAASASEEDKDSQKSKETTDAKDEAADSSKQSESSSSSSSQSAPAASSPSSSAAPAPVPSRKSPSASPPPSASSMDVDKDSSASAVPPAPPHPSTGSRASPSPSNISMIKSMVSMFGSPKTPEASSRTPGSGAPAPKRPASTTPAVGDPSWFATLVAAAQALENFAEQSRSGSVPPISEEAKACASKEEKSSSSASGSSMSSSCPNPSSSAMAVDLPIATDVPQVDSIALQFTKDAIRNAWTNTRSQDNVRPRLFLLENIPTVDADKRAELATALEELVEEKGLVADLYLPIDYITRKTKNWMIVEVQSPDNIPSLLTFKDPNFTSNQPVKIALVPIRRLLEKSRAPSAKDSGASASNASNAASQAISAATNSSSSSSAAPATSTSKNESSSSSSPSSAPPSDGGAVTKGDLHYDEPEASLEAPYAHLDMRWREYVRSRMWDKRTQQLTREFRDAVTETFLRFCTGHSLAGVLGKAQFNALQLAAGGELIADDGFDFFFSFGTKTHKYTPGRLPHPGHSLFMGAHKVRETTSTGDDSKNASKMQESEVEETGLDLTAFLTMYTNQALQMPLTTLEEFTNLGYDLHLNRTTFGSLEEAENAIIGNELLTPKSDLELVRYAEQLVSEMDGGSALQMNVSHIKGISMESHLAQLYPRLVRLSTPLLCLRYEMLRQFNQKVNEVFALINMGSTGELASWMSECRGLLFHSLKMNFVYRVLERTSDGSSACPSVILNRIDISANKDAVMAARTEEMFSKKTAFGQAFLQLQNTDPVAFRRPKPNGAEPHFAMRVLFQKENVQGDGGPYRQFFTDIAKELAEVLPLLVPCPNAQTKIGNNRDKFVITPSSNSNTYLKMYRFLGKLMGMAMRTGVMLAVDLPSFFWKPLVGMTPLPQDIRDIDHSFHTVLSYLKTCSPNVFEGETRTIFDHFQTTLSDKSKMLLKPAGDTLEVTYDNRLEYCRLAEAARINESFMQITEIRRGLADFIPLSLLNMFTWQDLQWRICGRPQIDLKLLKRHTEYAEGISPTSPHIRYFWQVLRSFSQEDRRAFVRFAWAQERLPADDQEFARSQTRMMIKPGPVSDQVFPTADTCFFNLSLPVYSSPDIMRERLLFAIHTDGAMDNDRPNQNDHDN